MHSWNPVWLKSLFLHRLQFWVGIVFLNEDHFPLLHLNQDRNWWELNGRLSIKLGGGTASSINCSASEINNTIAWVIEMALCDRNINCQWSDAISVNKDWLHIPCPSDCFWIEIENTNDQISSGHFLEVNDLRWLSWHVILFYHIPIFKICTICIGPAERPVWLSIWHSKLVFKCEDHHWMVLNAKTNSQRTSLNWLKAKLWEVHYPYSGGKKPWTTGKKGWTTE
jgi:hypothetical protein